MEPSVQIMNRLRYYGVLLICIAIGALAVNGGLGAQHPRILVTPNENAGTR